MKFNESCNSTAKATIVCRDSNDCESSNHHAAKGAGYYEQKAYNPTIKVICEINGVTLRTVKSIDTKVEILIDGELFNRYPSVKVAETFFVDFADISKAKFKKIACLA